MAGVRRGIQKKRHTKPCKFFQTNECPLTAEVCDFAHIMAVPVVSQLPPPCRYYLAGSCNNGLLCRYRHGEDTGGDTQLTKTEDASALSPTPSHDISITIQQESQPTNRPPMYTSYGMPYQPFWGPQVPPGMYPNRLLISSFPQPEFRSRDSVSSGSSSLSRSDFDEAYIMTEDPQYTEHSHLHQSRIQVYEEQQSMPIVFPSIDHYKPSGIGTSKSPSQSPVSPGSVPGLSPRKSRHSGKNKEHLMNQLNRASSIIPQKAAQLEMNVPCELLLSYFYALASIFAVLAFMGSLPPKPLSPREESTKKNFFPIAWRVIGGGVLISSKKEQENSLSRDRESIQDEATLAGEGVHAATATFIQSAVATAYHDETSRPRGRMRANSIPPTPSTAHVKIDTLFSAESPGVL